MAEASMASELQVRNSLREWGMILLDKPALKVDKSLQP
jgi:hypothetical protein